VKNLETGRTIEGAGNIIAFSLSFVIPLELFDPLSSDKP